MKIVVSKDIVKIENNHSENHYGEYNVNECTFQFDNYFNNVSVKRAVFTSRINNKSIEVDVINNKCMVPSEILKNVYDEVTLGVYGYEVSGEDLLVRYSPTPDKFVVHDGSYKENAEHPEIITPSQYDIYSQALQEGLDRVDDKLVDVEKQGDYANTQGDYAKEQGDYAKDQGTNAKNVADDTQKKAEEGKFNGKSLEFVWQGTKLGVRLEGQEEYQFVDLQGVQGEIGATGEPFKIKKTYASVSEMNADFGNMQFGDYVMIASSVNEEDNAKLYTKGESAWIFISDFSGAMGIRGETGLTPNIKIGEVKTLEAGSQAKVTRSGSNEEPVFNFEIPKGDKGDDYVLTEEDKVEIGEKVNTEYEKRIEENEKDIVDLEATIDILTNTDTKKGELVHITDALPLATFENKVDGNVEQETTKGNQLYNYKVTTQISSGISVDEDGWVTATYDNTNGTETKYLNYWTHNLNLKPDTDYLIVTEIKNVSGLGALQVVSKSGTTGQFITQHAYQFSNLSNNSINLFTEKTVSSFDGIYNGLRTFVSFSVGRSGSITFRLSVLEDTTVTADNFVYEKFTGGQASPNPEFPQEVEVLEAHNKFNINTITENKYIDGVTGEIANSSASNASDYIEIEANKKFTLLFKYNSLVNTGNRVIAFYDTNKNFLNGIVYNPANKPITFTTPNDAKFVRFSYDKNIYDIQLVKGRKEKPYNPYGCVSYKVNGKNLLNLNTTPIYVSGASSTFNEPNITITKTTPSLNASCVFIVGDANILNGKTLKYTGKLLSGTGRAIIGYADADGGNRVTIAGNTNINSGTFERTITVDGTTYANKKVVVWLYSDVLTTGNIGDKIIYKNVMVSENGGKYEPYQEQIVPLDLKGNFIGKIKDTDIEDYLVTDKKRLWLVKNVNRGLISIDNYPYETDTRMWFFFPKPTDSIDYDKYTTNGFSEVALRGETKPIHFNGGGNLLKYSIAYNKSQVDKIPTNDEIKELVDGKYFYYQLKEPQIIELGELPEPITTFEGTNNIQVLANLDTEIEVKYALDLKKYYDNKLAEISAQII